MASTGFMKHAAQNRRRAVLSLGLYCLTFVPVALLALGFVPLILGNTSDSILANPLSYALTYVPVAIVLSLALLANGFHSLRRQVAERLRIAIVTKRQEPRFVQIADAQAITQGLRCPTFGVIETAACNAVAIGGFPGQRLIAVTRGALDTLDDDELAAVIAHELAHFRLGDTTLLTLNHAMKRTAILLQTYNPIKVDMNHHEKVQWHFIGAIILPIFLVAFMTGGFVTWCAWKLSLWADSRVRTSRDLIADAEAVRFTHFPEALESAIAKCERQGYFEGAERFEALLFAGSPPRHGGTHPSLEEREASLRSLVGPLYDAARARKDTRGARPIASAATSSVPRAAGFGGGFGRKGVTRAPLGQAPAVASPPMSSAHGVNNFAKARARPKKPPQKPGLWLFQLWAFDRTAYRQWQRDEFEQLAWRTSDNRNFLGATTEATIWVVGCFMISVAFHSYYAKGPSDAIYRMSGQHFLQMADKPFRMTACSPGPGQAPGSVCGNNRSPNSPQPNSL